MRRFPHVAAGILTAAACTFAALPLVGDTVIRIDAATGTAKVRNSRTGRVMAFRASAADLALLRVGDPVEADWAAGSLTKAGSLTRALPLTEPAAAAPCCAVVAVAKDRAIANGLLAGIVTTAGKPYDAVAPFHGVVIAKDTASGALHVLEMAVEATQGTGTVGSPLIDSVKTDDPVAVEGAYGYLQARGQTFAFGLRGAETRDAQPWVIEPDAKAQGRYGIIRTVWHEKSSAAFQRIKVYLPGKRDKDEYHEDWKREHSVIEGEYDVMINGMVLEKTPVKAGHATRILLGALRSTAKFADQLTILDAKDRLVAKIQGGNVIALPIGIYHLKVGTRTLKIAIKEGEVTDF